MSIFRISKSIILFLIPLSILCTVCSCYITPWAITKSDQYGKYLQNKYDVAELTEGVFKTIPYTNNVYYIEELTNHKTTLHNLFLEYSDSKENTYNITSEKGKINTLNPKKIIVELTHGSRDQIYSSGQLIHSLNFEYSTLTIIPQYNMMPNDDIRAYNLSKILHSLEQPRSRSELIWRLSVGLMLLTNSILAFPISIKLNRKVNNLHFILIPLIYGVYQNTMYVVRAYTSNNHLHSMLWAFSVHILIILTAFLLIFIKSMPKK